jgi:hypothetical protein
MKNSFKISKAIKKNEDKFKEIKEISEEINAVLKLKSNREKQLTKVYEIIFKGLCSKKVKVTQSGGAEYFISPMGISVKKWKWGVNASGISSHGENLIQELLNINNLYDEFYAKIPSKDKRLMFKKFMRNIKLLKTKELPRFEVNKKIYLPIRYYEDGIMRLKEVFSMKVDFTEFGDKVVLSTERHEKDYSLNPFRLRIEDAIIFEQLYVEIKKALQTTLKNHKKDLANMEKYLNYLDLQFSAYIKSIETLNELKK